jgi:hypothetical protein
MTPHDPELTPNPAQAGGEALEPDDSVGTDDGLCPRMSHPKKRAFLAAYAQVGSVSGAARAAGVSRRSHSRWLEDADYASAFETAKDEAADTLEDEARRRAFEGSDVLLIFLLKGALPQKYGHAGTRTTINVLQQQQAARQANQQINQDNRSLDISPERQAEYAGWLRIIHQGEAALALPTKPAGGNGEHGGNANGQH